MYGQSVGHGRLPGMVWRDKSLDSALVPIVSVHDHNPKTLRHTHTLIYQLTKYCKRALISATSLLVSTPRATYSTRLRYALRSSSPSSSPSWAILPRSST